MTIEEAQGQLSQLMELAQAGHEVIIQDPQKGKARLVPVAEPSPGPSRCPLQSHTTKHTTPARLTPANSRLDAFMFALSFTGLADPNSRVAARGPA